MDSLRLVDRWPVGRAAAGVATAGGTLATHGDPDAVFRWASVTKPATALAVLVAAEEGTVGLDDPLVPWGGTVRQALAHASGLAPERPVSKLAEPATRRIYSNAGFELLGERITEAAGIEFAGYLQAAVLDPLGMDRTRFAGSPAGGLAGPLADVLKLGSELLAPQVVDGATLAEATATLYPGLPGVLPGFGPQADCAFGLGFEVKAGKAPHWTAPGGSPRTFGHFGRSGGFLWVDPDAGLACAALTDRDFGSWAVEAWPAFAGAVLGEWRGA